MWVIMRLVVAGVAGALAGEPLVEAVGLELEPQAARTSAAATAARRMSERRMLFLRSMGRIWNLIRR
jgi:hypothetical protein